MPTKKSIGDLLLTRPLLAALLVILTYLVLVVLVRIVGGDVSGVADFAVRVGVMLGVLGLVVYWLCKHLSLQHVALLASEKRGIAGLYASAIAHDINNVLMVLDFGREQMERSARSPERMRKWNASSLQAIEKLTALARRLGSVGRQGVGCREPIDDDLCAWLTECVEFARMHRSVHGCTVRIDCAQGLQARFCPNALEPAVINLVLNAAQATCGTGTVEVRVRQTGGETVVEVHDDDGGIEPQEREKVLNAFYTTKPDGTGLGLLSVKACAEVHGGRYEVIDSHLGGACFRLRLPWGSEAVG